MQLLQRTALTARGQWAGKFLQCTSRLPGGSGQRKSYHALPTGDCNFCNALPHRLEAARRGTLAMCKPTSWGNGESRPGDGRYLKTEMLPCTATLPGGSGQYVSCNVLTCCLGVVGSAMAAMHATLPGAVGNGNPAMHCLAAFGRWAMQLRQCTAPLPGGSGQWEACNTLPLCQGALGSGTPGTHCLTA